MQPIKKGSLILKMVLLVSLTIASSCKKYLDIIPDNIPTLDNAFTMRSEAEKYLYTCYSYMPKDGNLGSDPAILGGDEMWAIYNPPRPEFNHYIFNLARGTQATIDPIAGYYWGDLYRGIRDCNIFLENVGKVPDLTAQERAQWIAEVKFLKAYYHFYLVRMYGPVPIIKENLPIDVSIDKVKVSRDPVDDCFAYIVQLLNEAKDDLPLIVGDPTKMLGRITKPIAYALKAKVLVTAASPLFNGNSDMGSLKNKDGKSLFSSAVSTVKWDSAAVACKKAIDICHQAGNKLYVFNPAVSPYKLTDSTKTTMSIRNAFAEKWNSEVIWANSQSISNLTQKVAAVNVDFRYIDNPRIMSELAPPIKIAEMFYSDKGVPITEDKTWNKDKLTLRTATVAEQRYIRKDYTTSAINFDREPRFYANLGFDGGVWYGQGSYDDTNPSSLYYVSSRKGQPDGKTQPDYGSPTGYFVKKYVHYQNVQGAGVSDYTVNEYPWPLIRLAQLYLMYAESLNEIAGPTAEVHQYINLVRERAGLKSVQVSWDNYSNNPTKYSTLTGMREIIHQEELIEMAFEGSRFWDLRRWKEAIPQFRKPVQGWDIEQANPDFYYRRKVLFDQSFGLKDYFWPIKDGDILVNRNLVQNIGW
ncbi:RagB/SusD family nutrient uptake outer membrane protein [Pedobacter sp.]|jgi:hypothetical protein|uniref:RagB/SusD family nutrient uptake outer membrane protein n=1 Tax=Pedobacter sp. TaxID=1411316 RepID=UPI002CB70F43|nr:RagB/SusD family nutrient uptake outer membrane protein [Pedobacter sp.]HWW40210.1 RagB/SusD family nutrient uptake outer membrane protein [Pedobacter sp.]